MDIIAGVVIASGLVVIGSVGYIYYRSKCWMLRFEASQKTLQTDMFALASAAVGVGGRVTELDLRLRNILQRQEQQELNEPASHSYQQAKKLARRGVSMEELIDVYGLTQGEAELISMLNRLETEQPD